jgi:hypothetical protein
MAGGKVLTPPRSRNAKLPLQQPRPALLPMARSVGKQEEQFSSNLEVINSKVRATVEALV